MRALDKDRAFATLTIVIAIASGTVAFGYAAESAWFPRVLSVFIGMVGALLLWNSRASNDTGYNLNVKTALVVFASCVVYAIAIQYVSFEIVNYVFLVAAMYLLGQRNPWVIVAVATGTMLLVKLLFFVMLDVARPVGVLF